MFKNLERKRKIHTLKRVKRYAMLLMDDVLRDYSQNIKPFKIRLYIKDVFYLDTTLLETRNTLSKQLTQLNIRINLEQVQKIMHGGISGYYPNRGKRVNSYINNYYNTLKFCILHEKKHFIDALEFDDWLENSFTEEEAERRADTYAIQEIGRRKLVLV